MKISKLFSKVFIFGSILALPFQVSLAADSVKEEIPFEERPYVVLQRKVQEQAEIDRELLQELRSGNYSFAEPFVTVNPYGESPLTALALFTTDKKMKVAIKVHADNPIDDATFELSDYKTEHQIPIYGLYGGRVNKATLIGEYEDGKKETVELDIETDILPAFLGDASIITKHYKDGYYKGFNFPSHHLTFTAFDSEGDWRFTFNEKNFSFSTVFPTKTENGFFSILGSRVYGDAFIYEVNPLGRILSLYHTPAGVHHDMHLTDRNTLILTGSADTVTTDDAIQELDLTTGEIVNDLDYRTMLDIGRNYGLAYTKKDWLRNNSIVEDNNKLVMSGNHQSLVMSHDWNGNINWMLSDPNAYSSIYDEYILKVKGKNFKYPYNQHAVETLPDMDNNPDTVDILMFDNGLSRVVVNDEIQNKMTLNEIAEPYLFSRMVQYRINEKNMTVEQIWQYGEDRPELYTDWRGNADYLPNGNYFGSFELVDNIYKAGRLIYTGDRSFGKIMNNRKALGMILVEVDKNGDEVWEAILNSKSDQGIASYKTERLEIYTPNANDLEIGKKVNIFFPDKFLLVE